MYQSIYINVNVAIFTIKLLFNIYNELIKWTYYNVMSQYIELKKIHFFKTKFRFFTNLPLIFRCTNLRVVNIEEVGNHQPIINSWAKVSLQCNKISTHIILRYMESTLTLCYSRNQLTKKQLAFIVKFKQLFVTWRGSCQYLGLVIFETPLFGVQLPSIHFTIQIWVYRIIYIDDSTHLLIWSFHYIPIFSQSYTDHFHSNLF